MSVCATFWSLDARSGWQMRQSCWHKLLQHRTTRGGNAEQLPRPYSAGTAQTICFRVQRACNCDQCACLSSLLLQRNAPSRGSNITWRLFLQVLSFLLYKQDAGAWKLETEEPTIGSSGSYPGLQLVNVIWIIRVCHIASYQLTQMTGWMAGAVESSRCLFCKIAGKNDPSTELLFEVSK